MFVCASEEENALRQVILWVRVDGVSTGASSMGREVEAASALLFVSTVSVLHIECVE